MQALKITELRDAAALAALVPEWENLAANALEPNPAYEPWMLLPALEAYGGGQELRFVLVHYAGELAGFFPLKAERRFRGLPVRTLSSWRHPHCMLCVPLVRASVASKVLAAFLQWARANASVVDLSHLIAEGAFHQALVDALNEVEYTSAITDAYTRPLLLRSKEAMPRDVRRREKRLYEAGTVERLVLRSREELPRWIDEFLALEAAGWKGRRGSALACSETNRRFAHQLFTGAFERGRLIMVGINFNGRPAARVCGFTAGEGAIGFKTAYDESLRRYAPGMLAQVDLIRAFHERPELQWMDSYSDAGNAAVDELWRHRRTVQRVAIAADARGELALALLPLMRLFKRFVGKFRIRRAARTIPSLKPA
jgi:CelD/BcsL family acetyltransferase involved in cellulose biosynthesis